jgi:hypothetical protein
VMRKPLGDLIGEVTGSPLNYKQNAETRATNYEHSDYLKSKNLVHSTLIHEEKNKTNSEEKK